MERFKKEKRYMNSIANKIRVNPLDAFGERSHPAMRVIVNCGFSYNLEEVFKLPLLGNEECVNSILNAP